MTKYPTSHQTALKRICRYLFGSRTYRSARASELSSALNAVDGDSLPTLLNDLGTLGLLLTIRGQSSPGHYEAVSGAYAYHQTKLRRVLEQELRRAGREQSPLLLGGLVNGAMLYEHQEERACDDVVLIAYDGVSRAEIEQRLAGLGFEQRNITQTDSSIRDDVYFEKSFQYDLPEGMADDFRQLHGIAPNCFGRIVENPLRVRGTMKIEVRDSLFQYRDGHSAGISDEDLIAVEGLGCYRTLGMSAAVPYLASQMLLYIATEPIRSARFVADLIRSLDNLDPQYVPRVIQNAGEWGTLGHLKTALEGIVDYVPGVALDGLSQVGRDLVSALIDSTMGLGGLRFGILTVLNRVEPGKLLYHEAMLEHDGITEYFGESNPGVELTAVGSYARCDEVVDSLDFYVPSADFTFIADALAGYHRVTAELFRSETRTELKLQSGIALRVSAVSEEVMPLVILHETLAPKTMNFLRERAAERSLVLTEESLTRDGSRIRCATTADVFRALDLQPRAAMSKPWQRNDALFFEGDEYTGCDIDNVRGVLHVHTPYSDGATPIETLVRAASELGYEYIGLSDHNYGERFRSRFLKEQDIARLFDEVDGVQQRYPDLTILKGLECDIRHDGTLAMSDEALSSFDFVIAAIHYADGHAALSPFDRMLKAIQNPYVNVLAHPSNRMLLTHPGYITEGISSRGYDVDWDGLISACHANHVLMECNVAPHRMDINRQVAARVLASGMPLVICPDAHSVRHLAYMKSGFRILESVIRSPEDLINCWTTEEVLSLFRSQRAMKSVAL